MQVFLYVPGMNVCCFDFWRLYSGFDQGFINENDLGDDAAVAVSSSTGIDAAAARRLQEQVGATLTLFRSTSLSFFWTKRLRSQSIFGVCTLQYQQ